MAVGREDFGGSEVSGEIPRVDLDYIGLKIGVLRQLRELLYYVAARNDPTGLDLTFAAATLGQSPELVQGTIAELIKLGHVEPMDARMPHLAVQRGDCRITPQGLAFLEKYEMVDHLKRKVQEELPPESPRRPAGYIDTTRE
jgi:hypothetical protein